MSEVPDKKTTDDVAGRVDRLVRRPYHRPELVAYGPLAKLTRSNKSGTGEVTPQGEMMMCL